jgi:TPR repeat protein
MQSINFSTDMSLHAASATGTKSGLLRWLPGAALAAVVGAAVLLGTHDKAGDELQWLSRLATEGSSGAELQLGLAYRDGLYGLSPDAQTGFHWLKKAADSGNPYAEDAVASAYTKGQGTGKDLEASRQWRLKAIAQGNKGARLHLGEELLLEGKPEQAENFLQ